MKIIICSAGTYMNYPIKQISISEDLTLYLPIPEAIRPAYEKTLSAEGEIPFPYWARVWPSSIALTSYLAVNKHLISNKKVLEIGAGTGLPSFSIARMAASVIISDHSTDAVELMEKNIAYLELDNVQALCLDWNNFPEDIHAEVVLLSDINYAPGEFDSLLLLIERFLAIGATVIISTPQRIMGVPFALQLAPYIESKAELMAEDTSISLFVLSMKN